MQGSSNELERKAKVHTRPGDLAGKVFSQNAGMAHWKCCKCGYTLQADIPPKTCPECGEICAFINVTCYIPQCGGCSHIDPRL